MRPHKELMLYQGTLEESSHKGETSSLLTSAHFLIISASMSSPSLEFIPLIITKKSTMVDNPLTQLKNGVAEFELVSTPFLSISSQLSLTRNKPFTSAHNDNSHRFFARIGPSLGGASPAMKKLERYSVQRVTGDGRCMFRALVKGMAANKGIPLSSREERDEADDLRMAVKEVLCDDEKERLQYEGALIAITVDEPLNRYCQRIGRSDFWGGESELLVLSKLCRQPIVVYIPEHEHTRGWGSGFIPIAEYGSEFRLKKRKTEATREASL